MKDLNAHFEKLYIKWKNHMNGLKRTLKIDDDANLIDEVVNAINGIQILRLFSWK